MNVTVGTGVKIYNFFSNKHYIGTVTSVDQFMWGVKIEGLTFRDTFYFSNKTMTGLGGAGQNLIIEGFFN